MDVWFIKAKGGTVNWDEFPNLWVERDPYHFGL